MKINVFNRRFVGRPEFTPDNGLIDYRSAAFVLVSLALTIFSSCIIRPQRKNPASFLPILKYELYYFAGSPMLAFAPVDMNSLRAEDSLAVSVTLIAAGQFPADFLATAESQTHMIKVFPSDEIVAPMTRLTRGTRVGPVEDAERFIVNLTGQEPDEAVILKRFYGVLPPDITASFRFVEGNPVDARSPEGIEIQVSRCSKATDVLKDESAGIPSLEIALVASGRIKQKTVFEDAGQEAKDDGEVEKNTSRQIKEIKVTETVFLEPRPFRIQDQFAIIVPSPFDAIEPVAFAIVIDVKSPPPDEDRVAVSRYTWAFNECMTHITGENFIERKSGKEEPDTEWPGFENAIQSLQSPAIQRQVLLYLAERTGAFLTEDIALSGSDMIIGRLSQALINEYSSGSITSSTFLGWKLERTSYGLLATLLSGDQATPELEAILVRYTGQVGRYVSTLEELTARATNIDEFQTLLEQENFIYLEDISPAARARAFEWLKARGKAPDGYDPLAPLKERRNVLRSAEKSLDVE